LTAVSSQRIRSHSKCGGNDTGREK